MKVQTMIRTIAALGVFAFSLSANANEAWRARMHQKIQKEIASCENASFNLDSNGQPKVTLPAPVQGQRPELTADQKALLHACKQAGILRFHRHHHNRSQAQAVQGQDARQPSSN